ncbi:twin-arginine translocase subunit TatB [Marinicauda salina]|uniref:Sec-independent protein translocase protein TatB n=1 Tax=Marinicauda salina TaxID=2135793 RepID=A0A2U2BT32_9PROT|nr:Sec-independent protein translocase protein TatB [Marinicauda salina]PWE17147.1 twin-arginine translocase subunit TatB [Marinicauda salina]
MNPGIGAPELLVLLILALVVVGPKDLPLMMRKLGRFVGQARAMARDFQRSFDELGREAELAELRKEIETLKDANPVGDVTRELKDAEADLRAGGEDRPHPRAADAKREAARAKKLGVVAGEPAPAERAETDKTGGD